MQSVLGALLAAAPHHRQITASVQNQLEKSFAGARAVAQRYPHYSSKITAAAKSAFLAGDKWAYAAGIGAVLIGAAVVAFFFPKKEQEEALLARYHAQDAAGRAAGRIGSHPGKS
jgi:MFS transporter, DHA2 family, multidrug resistance protein